MNERRVIQRAVIITLSFTLFLWLVKAVEWLAGINLTALGLYPRRLPGMIGILTGPLIHGGAVHLVSNTLPLIILGIGLFYFYYKIALEVFIWIYAATGVWVWLIGREAYHIGASGLIYGLMSFIFVSGLIRRNSRSLAISMAVFVLYGGMIYGIFPGEESISWESHLMGLLSGILVAAFFWRHPIFTGDEVLPEQKEEFPTDSNYFSDPDSTSDSNIETTVEYKPSDKKHGSRRG